MTWVDYFIRQILIKQPQTFFKIFNRDLRDEVRGKIFGGRFVSLQGSGLVMIEGPLSSEAVLHKKINSQD